MIVKTRSLSAFCPAQTFDLFHEFSYILKLAVHGGEPDVGNGVKLVQGFHDTFADVGCRHFPVPFGLDILDKGAKKAQERASQTMLEVRNLINI